MMIIIIIIIIIITIIIIKSHGTGRSNSPCTISVQNPHPVIE